MDDAAPAPGLERALRRAAFGPEPEIATRTLARARTASPRCRWLAAVLHGARGEYAAATAILAALGTHPDPALAALARSTLASHRRQLGGHGVALGLDGAALLSAAVAGPAPADEDGVDARGALADALLGLAADNLGLGRLTVARRVLARAGDLPLGWRGQVRAGWVGAELELAAGRPEAALDPAERAAKLAAARGAFRHGLKSDLVLAAALAATGDRAARERATKLALAALEATQRHGVASLAWPAGLIAADLDAGHADRYRSSASQVLHGVLLRSEAVGRRIAAGSPWVPL
jgi:hypothetical protein